MNQQNMPGRYVLVEQAQMEIVSANRGDQPGPSMYAGIRPGEQPPRWIAGRTIPATGQYRQLGSRYDYHGNQAAQGGAVGQGAPPRVATPYTAVSQGGYFRPTLSTVPGSSVGTLPSIMGRTPTDERRIEIEDALTRRGSAPGVMVSGEEPMEETETDHAQTEKADATTEAGRTGWTTDPKGRS